MVTARANDDTAIDRDPLIPVMRTKFLKGWPEHDDAGDGHRVTYEPVSMGMTHAYGTDAHFAAYSVPSVPRRLATPLVFAETEVPIVLLILDVEPEGHTPVTAEWWAAVRESVAQLSAADSVAEFCLTAARKVRAPDTSVPPITVPVRSGCDPSTPVSMTAMVVPAPLVTAQARCTP